MNVSGIIYICFSNSVYDYFKYKYIIYITVRNYYPCRPDHVRLSVNMNVQIYATIITIDTTSRFKSRRICAIPPILVILIFLSISNLFESVSSCQPMLSYFDHQLLYLLPIAYLFPLTIWFSFNWGFGSIKWWACPACLHLDPNSKVCSHLSSIHLI